MKLQPQQIVLVEAQDKIELWALTADGELFVQWENEWEHIQVATTTK